MNQDEARCPAPSTTYGLAQEAAGQNLKEVQRKDVSYIDHAPDNQVVLSQRLEHLCRRVGGCQTDELLALVRRVMYEVLATSKKY
jgi:hypothetical protein